MSIPRCHVPDATGSVVRLNAVDAHHVRHVLRLKEGDNLRIFDGRGHEWSARILRTDRRDVDVELLEPYAAVPEPPAAVTLGVGILKGDQMSTVVRDATALGAARIVPVSSSRVAVSGAARGDMLTPRLRRIAASAAAQCGRAVVPAIEPVAAFEDLLITGPADLRLMALEPGRATDDPAGWTALRRPSTVLVLIGPEGGWSDDEVHRAREAGVLPLSLGPRVLRAELAPTVALATLWVHWGW